MNTTIKRGLLFAIKKQYPDVIKLIYNGETKQVAWQNSKGGKFVQDSNDVDLSKLMLVYNINRLDFIDIDFVNEKIILTGDKEIII